MNPTMSARRVLALVCAVGLLAGASAALADDDGYLGVMLQDINSSMAKALQLDDDAGVLVSQVIDDSPADEAGLEDGDVILEFDGRTIEDGGDLRRVVRRTDPGDEVEVVVLREGERRTIDVEIGEAGDGAFWVSKDDNVWFGKDQDFEFEFDDDVYVERFGDGDDARVIIKRLHDGDHDVDVYVHGMNTDRGYMGVHLDDLSEQLGEYFGVDDGDGALITEVIDDSPAAAAGLEAGDVIVKLDGEDIESANDLHDAMRHTEVEQEVAVEVMRKGRSKELEVTLGEMPEEAIKRHIEILGDGDVRMVAPKMMMRFPHMKKNMRFHRPEGLRMLREFHVDDDELDEMREELDKLRAELDEMRKELRK